MPRRSDHSTQTLQLGQPVRYLTDQESHARWDWQRSDLILERAWATWARRVPHAALEAHTGYLATGSTGRQVPLR